MKRKRVTYISLILSIIAVGLPSRLYSQHLPSWYVTYAGDFLWAMVVYFFIANIFNLSLRSAFITALVVTYIIEISQLFHPVWLDSIRSVKIFALILGHGFLWSDIVAYTLGISLSVVIDWSITRNQAGE